MKVAFKSLMAAAAFIAVAGASHAATVSVTAGSTVYKGVKISGSETLTFSVDALSVFDIYAAALSSYGSATVTSNKDADGFMYTDAAMSTAVTSLNVDDVTDQALAVASSGGLTMTVPARKGISSGGTLTITDLNVDLASKTVYATIIGSNGVGTLNNVPVWNFSGVAGGTTVVPAGGNSGTATFTVSGLALTQEAFNQAVASLRLGTLGRAAMLAVSDYGTVSFSLTAVREMPACAVTFKTTNKNATLFDTEVKVENHTSNPATGWSVSWNYDKPTLLIAPKNAKLSDKGAQLKSYSAKPVATNETIAADGSTTFSFKGHANGTAPVLSDVSASIGGLACAVSVAP